MLEEVDDDTWRLIYSRTLLAMLVRRGKRLVTLSPPIDDEEHDTEETESSRPVVTYVTHVLTPYLS